MKSVHPVIDKILSRVQPIASMITGDKITVYAAQASFFVIISAVPFISLLVSVIGLLIPADVQSIFTDIKIPDSLASVLGSALDNIRNAPNVSLLSLSAVTALWSASKGTAAIRSGLETVYHAESTRGFIMQRLWSLVSTLLFIILIIALIVVLLFGNFISDLLGIYHITDVIMWLRFPVAFVLMCVVFCVMYSSTAKRGRLVRSDFLVHIPGAVFSSIGWILFSFFYSLYIAYFPNASYIYGGLAAVCLIMLWIYFCMIILLLGAELNKLYFIWRNQKKFGNDTAEAFCPKGDENI